MQIPTIIQVIISIIAFIIAYIGLSRKTKYNHYVKGLISLMCVVAGARLYDAIYHYTFVYGTANIIADLTSISLNVPWSGTVFPLTGAIILILFPFAFYKNMKRNKFLGLAIVAGIILFAFWFALGYPQYANPQWFPQLTPLINLVPNNTSSIMLWGLALLALTKVVCLIPALLFWKGSKRKKINKIRI